MNLLEEFLYKSKTAFHACENAAEILKKNGFTELKETRKIFRNEKRLRAYRLQYRRGKRVQHRRFSRRFPVLQNQGKPRDEKR